MAFGNFVPEIWSAALLLKLRDQLVYAQPGMINRNYEGEVARAGDTVRITTPADVAVRDYVKNSGADNDGDPIAGITYDLLDDTQQTITVAQAKYFGIQVDDIDKRQGLPGFVEAAVTNAARSMAEATDTYVVGKMTAGVPSGNALADGNVTDPSDAYDLLVSLRTILQRGKAPASGRWVVVPPEVYALLLKDDRFIRQDASGTTEGLRNGQVGRAAGFDVVESNTVPFTGTGAATKYTVLAGHGDATTFIDQIVSTEALRLQSGFSDAVRGLHLFDCAVLTQRASLLAKGAVTVGPQS